MMTSKELFSNQDAAAELALLSERSLRREEGLQNFNNVRSLVDSDEETDSSCPEVDQF